LTQLFPNIDFETISTCNRVCPTCIRNSHPDREALRSWFEPHYLPVNVIQKALNECVDLGFSGGVCLSHYNEPLMDERIADIAGMVKSYNRFFVFMNTNGDFLREDLAERLDGKLDRIFVSLYMDEPVKSKRAIWIESLFHKTEVQPITMSKHITTHFSPNLANRAERIYPRNPCGEPKMRVIINHLRQFLLCCDDVIGNFDLGTFPEISIKDYWFGGKHRGIVESLSRFKGRDWHSYCMSCPRP
jgi:hypothetical protein